MGTRFRAGSQDGTLIASRPIAPLAKYAQLATISFRYNYQNAVWQLPYAVHKGPDTMPSFAAAIADAKGKPGSSFTVDYSTSVNSIPSISAGDILSGRVPASRIAGKDVIIGTNSDLIGDRYFIPGYGRGRRCLRSRARRRNPKIWNAGAASAGFQGSCIAFCAGAIAACCAERFADRIVLFTTGGTCWSSRRSSWKLSSFSPT